MDFEITWQSNHMGIYKYGSDIEFMKTEVHFENELIPPGTALIKWKSHANYLFDRTPLQLPLLKRKETYRLILEAKTYPEASVLLKVDFFDRLGNYKATEVLTDADGEFVYPETAYSYTISIISTGVRKFIFKQLLLTTRKKEVEEKKVLETKRSKKRRKK